MSDVGGEAVGDCLDVIMEIFFVSFDPNKDPELRLRFEFNPAGTGAARLV